MLKVQPRTPVDVDLTCKVYLRICKHKKYSLEQTLRGEIGGMSETSQGNKSPSIYLFNATFLCALFLHPSLQSMLVVYIYIYICIQYIMLKRQYQQQGVWYSCIVCLVLLLLLDRRVVILFALYGCILGVKRKLSSHAYPSSAKAR